MSEGLKGLLETILPTYQYQMPGGIDAAITYQPMYAADRVYESGEVREQLVTYRVTIFQRKNDDSIVRKVVSALRAAGWTVTDREWMIDTDNRYYQHAINIDKMEVIKNENLGP